MHSQNGTINVNCSPKSVNVYDMTFKVKLFKRWIEVTYAEEKSKLSTNF